jgi:EAL domain-containing protein (putative c-di-GMP-specific phosphodiesterase class I)
LVQDALLLRLLLSAHLVLQIDVTELLAVLAQDLAIISALLDLGRGFNLRIVAEGVETQQQLEILQGLDCEEAQGYLFHHPLNADQATELLKRHFSVS